MHKALGFAVSALLGCLVLLTLASAPARARALDCNHAAGAVALAVCADDALPELDRLMAAALAGARAALGEGETGGAVCLAEDQDRWEREVRQPCGGSADCLRRVYLERLATLDGLQPGANRITAFDLPDAPVLVTALPPVPEARGQPVGGPYALTGQLVHESEDAENMGLAIRSLAGRSTVLVPDMDIGDSPAHAALQSAIKAGGDATYRVEGRMNPMTGGFAMNQCRFVYRLPEE